MEKLSSVYPVCLLDASMIHCLNRSFPSVPVGSHDSDVNGDERSRVTSSSWRESIDRLHHLLLLLIRASGVYRLVRGAQYSKDFSLSTLTTSACVCRTLILSEEILEESDAYSLRAKNWLVPVKVQEELVTPGNGTHLL